MTLRSMTALLLLGFALNSSFSFAGDLADASGIVATGALSAVAAPVLLVGGTAAGASAATTGIVKLVGETGESMTDLTLDALKDIQYDMTTTTVDCPKPCSVNVTVNQTQKEIPLVVRKQYVELNQRIEIQH